MKAPSVVHPKTIDINGFRFKVVAYCALTDRQALAIAMRHYRTHKLKKKDQKKLHTIITLFDEDSLGRL